LLIVVIIVVVVIVIIIVIEVDGLSAPGPEREGLLIIVCWFIPGGRTAVTLSCGLIRYSWRRFAVATAIAAVIWASYAFFAGRIGGKAFEDMPVVGFAVAFGGALVISGIIELIRRIVAWRKVKRKMEQKMEQKDEQKDESEGAPPEA